MAMKLTREETSPKILNPPCSKIHYANPKKEDTKITGKITKIPTTISITAKEITKILTKTIEAAIKPTPKHSMMTTPTPNIKEDNNKTPIGKTNNHTIIVRTHNKANPAAKISSNIKIRAMLPHKNQCGYLKIKI